MVTVDTISRKPTKGWFLLASELELSWSRSRSRKITYELEFGDVGFCGSETGERRRVSSCHLGCNSPSWL